MLFFPRLTLLFVELWCSEDWIMTTKPCWWQSKEFETAGWRLPASGDCVAVLPKTKKTEQDKGDDLTLCQTPSHDVFHPYRLLVPYWLILSSGLRSSGRNMFTSCVDFALFAERIVKNCYKWINYLLFNGIHDLITEHNPQAKFCTLLHSVVDIMV